MDIFDVFPNNELEELSDDPREAFVQFVRKAKKALDQEVERALMDNQEDGWRAADEYRYDYMSMVLAAAKRFGITEFKAKILPERREWDYDVFRQFQSELNHFLTQIVLDNASRGKRDGVAIPPKSKDRIRQHIHHLKKLIDAADLDEGRKAALHVKLERFEQELEKRRLPLAAIGLFTLELMTIPGGVWQTGELANKLVHDVIRIVHEAKVADDETRLLPPAIEPAQLSPPRPGRKPSSAAPAFESGMDDDIPF